MVGVMNLRQLVTLRAEDRRDRILVTLNRPAERNAIDAAMVAELHQLCALLEAQPRILILTGGDAGFFASGADVAQLRERGRNEALAGINLSLFERIRRLPLPSIAAVDGYALGGGAELSYACDVRIASTRARFGQPETELGIMAGAGGAHRLVRLVGESVAKQILLAGRKLSAAEAQRVGLVLSVVEPEQLLATADAVASRMLPGTARAQRQTKLVVDAEAAAHPQVDLLAQAILFEDEEKYARMGAFLDRRASS
jgi:enoyl-CoA hydratase